MLSVVVGGFYGDEGKGKTVGYLAVKDDADFVVRAGGGPQAGHTVTKGMKVTQIPSGFINIKSRLLIGRGTIINPEVVLEEIEKYDVSERIGIDYGCTIIKPEHKRRERELVERIGSVGTGTGPARVDRVLRKAVIAKDVEELKPYLTDVGLEVNEALMHDKNILVEGVQGYGLSLLDYRFYPFVTSQDTTASQFLADIGVGPKAVDEVYVIYKAYISRVGKGPLPTEWTIEEVMRHGIEERGTVSGRVRRLGDFDKEMALESLTRNTGTQAVITCIDRLYKGNNGVSKYKKLSKKARAFIEDIDSFLKENSSYFKGVTIISTGPDLEDMIDLR